VEADGADTSVTAVVLLVTARVDAGVNEVVVMSS
jgi:hypothetical protein